jgi:hypothetical protein
MPDVPGVAGRALHQVAVQDQAAADAGGDDHSEHVAGAPARPAPVLPGGQADGVVVHPDRGGAEPLRQPFAEREAAPGGDVDRGHQPGGPFHRAAAAAAEAGEPAAEAGAGAGAGREAGRVQHPGDQRVDGPPQALGVQVAPGRGLLPEQQPAPGPDESRGELGAADVDGQRRPVSFHHRLPPPEVREGSTCT